MTEGGALRELLTRLRMDLTDAQGKLTEAFRQLDALDIADKPVTVYARTLERARAGIADGWHRLTPQMLDIEFDLLGIAHTDRAALRDYARDSKRLNAFAGPKDRARETTEATNA